MSDLRLRMIKKSSLFTKEKGSTKEKLREKKKAKVFLSVH